MKDSTKKLLAEKRMEKDKQQMSSLKLALELLGDFLADADAAFSVKIFSYCESHESHRWATCQDWFDDHALCDDLGKLHKDFSDYCLNQIAGLRLWYATHKQFKDEGDIAELPTSEFDVDVLIFLAISIQCRCLEQEIEDTNGTFSRARRDEMDGWLRYIRLRKGTGSTDFESEVTLNTELGTLANEIGELKAALEVLD